MLQLYEASIAAYLNHGGPGAKQPYNGSQCFLWHLPGLVAKYMKEII